VRKASTIDRALRTETHTFRVGDTFLWSQAAAHPYAVVLEDDGETGYLYALELRDGEQSILDALLLYRVDAASEGHAAVASVVWSDEGDRVAVWLNGRQEAAVDFAERRAVCRTNFPPADGSFGSTHEWDDAVAADLMPPGG